MGNKKMITLADGEKIKVKTSEIEEGFYLEGKEFYCINDKVYIEDWLQDEGRDSYLLRYLEKKTKDFGYLGSYFYKLEKIDWFINNFKYMFDVKNMKFIEIKELMNYRKLWRYIEGKCEIIKIEDI